MANGDPDAAILDRLKQVTAQWTALDPKRLTASDEQALLMLTAAGFVERRLSLRIRMAGTKQSLEATITATGEYGLVEAMEGVVAEAWSLWGERYKAQRADKDGAAPAVLCERTQNEEVRLTDDGCTALKDIESGQQQRVLEFVRKTGYFGQASPLALQNPGNFIAGVGRPPVKGTIAAGR